MYSHGAEPGQVHELCQVLFHPTWHNAEAEGSWLWGSCILDVVWASAGWVRCVASQMFVSGQLHCWIYNAVSVKSQRMLQERLIIGRRGKLEADVEVWFLFTFFFLRELVEFSDNLELRDNGLTWGSTILDDSLWKISLENSFRIFSSLNLVII